MGTWASSLTTPRSLRSHRFPGSSTFLLSWRLDFQSLCLILVIVLQLESLWPQLPTPSWGCVWQGVRGICTSSFPLGNHLLSKVFEAWHGWQTVSMVIISLWGSPHGLASYPLLAWEKQSKGPPSPSSGFFLLSHLP